MKLQIDWIVLWSNLYSHLSSIHCLPTHIQVIFIQTITFILFISSRTATFMLHNPNSKEAYAMLMTTLCRCTNLLRPSMVSLERSVQMGKPLPLDGNPTIPGWGLNSYHHPHSLLNFITSNAITFIHSAIAPKLSCSSFSCLNSLEARSSYCTEKNLVLVLITMLTHTPYRLPKLAVFIGFLASGLIPDWIGLFPYNWTLRVKNQTKLTKKELLDASNQTMYWRG